MPVTHDQTAKRSARRHLDFCEVQMRKAAEYGDQAAVQRYADIIQKTLASLNALLKDSGDRRKLRAREGKKAPQKKRKNAAAVAAPPPIDVAEFTGDKSDAIVS